MKHRSSFFSTIVTMVFASLITSGLDGRTWSNAEGTKTFEGELKSYDKANGIVYVDDNGQSLSFKQELLSAADLDWLNRSLSDIAVPREVPPGSPKYSDVCMRSLVPRGNTLEAAESFHATRLEWMYLRPNHEFYRNVRKQKLFLGGTLITEASKSSLAGKYQVDLDGKHLTRWTGHAQGCANNPAYRAHFIQQARSALSKAQGIQVDNAGLNNGAKCFCTHCISGFQKYLSQTVSSEEWQALGLGVAKDTFDYKAYLLRIRNSEKEEANAAKDTAGSKEAEYEWAEDGNALNIGDNHVTDPSKVLREKYRSFQKKVSVEFHKYVRAKVNELSKRHVPMSVNNGSGGWGELQQVFDYGIGELRSSEAYASHIYHVCSKATNLGKHQVFTMPKPYAGVGVNRRTIATTYASGGHMLVPWDVFLGPKKRYFGKPGNYSDLFYFVREYAEYFDGYEDALAIGKDINDTRYTDEDRPVSIIQGAREFCAFVRAKPGDKNAPVVIHLVDWGKKPQASRIFLRPNWFFGDQALQVRLLRPGWKKNEDGQKEPTTSGEIIASGRVTEISLPPMEWGMLIVEPLRTPLEANVPWQPIITPSGGILVEPKEISITSLTPNSTIHYTLDGSEPDENSMTYTGPFTMNSHGTIRAIVRSENGKAQSAPVEVTFDGPIKAIKDTHVFRPGLHYSYHELHVDKLPPNTVKFRQARKKSGISNGLDLSLRNRYRSIAFHFKGYLDVPKTGIYEISLRSDDGSRLKLSGRKLIEMNYLQEKPGESSATVALERGKHPIFIEYFNWAYSGTPVLEMSWSGPGFEKQPVPASAFYYKE